MHMHSYTLKSVHTSPGGLRTAKLVAAKTIVIIVPIHCL